MLDRHAVDGHHDPAVAVDREVAQRVSARGAARAHEQRDGADGHGEGAQGTASRRSPEQLLCLLCRAAARAVIECHRSS